MIPKKGHGVESLAPDKQHLSGRVLEEAKRQELAGKEPGLMAGWDGKIEDWTYCYYK